MDNDDKTFIIIIVCVIIIMGNMVANGVVHIDSGINLTINSENISSYDVDTDVVTIVVNNGSIYRIKINEDYIDFTVNSKLYINIYKLNWAFWWWEKPWYGEKWHIDTVIKVPDGGE